MISRNTMSQNDHNHHNVTKNFTNAPFWQENWKNSVRSYFCIKFAKIFGCNVLKISKLGGGKLKFHFCFIFL